MAGDGRPVLPGTHDFDASARMPYTSRPRPCRSSPVSLFSDASRYIPGGVNSPVRAFRGVGGEPVFIERAAGCSRVRPGRPRLHRLCRLVGADDPRPRASRRDPRRAGASRARPVVRRPDADRDQGRGARLRDGAVDRAGAHGELGHRSDHERHPPGARLHRPRQDREVRRLLSRPLRFVAGEGRLGRADVRRADIAGRAEGIRGAHHHTRTTTTSPKCSSCSATAATRSPASSSSRSRAT